MNDYRIHDIITQIPRKEGNTNSTNSFESIEIGFSLRYCSGTRTILD